MADPAAQKPPRIPMPRPRSIPFYVHDAAGQDGLANVVRSGKREDNAKSWADLALKDAQTLVKLSPGTTPPVPHLHKVNVATGEFSDIPQKPALAYSQKIIELRSACAARITGGFRSNALNPAADVAVAFFYPSDLTSQVNLLHGSPVLCKDAAGVWLAREHTDAQLAAVKATFNSLRESCRTRLTALEAQARAAKGQAELDAIAWGKPTR